MADKDIVGYIREEEVMDVSIRYMLQFFTYEHLPPKLQDVSRPFSLLASHVARGPMTIETLASLRKLLEAKDCAVRAAIAKPLSHNIPDPTPSEDSQEPSP